MSAFRLQIVTPDGGIFDGEAEALRLRTTDGYVSIRAGHADYIATLDIGQADVTVGGTLRKAACGGGFLSVEKGSVRLVATSFEYAEDIDTDRANRSKERAEATLNASKEEKDIRLAKARLSRALNRLRIAGALK